MKRHRFDPYALVFGLSFAGLGVLLLDTDVDVADLAGAGWLPVPAVLGGLLLLAFGVDRARPPAPPLAADDEPPGDSGQT